MKRFLMMVAVSAFCLVGLAACSSQYVISTKDGRMLTTDSKPRLDDTTGMYIYDDEEGRETMVKKDDVVQILER